MQSVFTHILYCFENILCEPIDYDTEISAVGMIIFLLEQKSVWALGGIDFIAIPLLYRLKIQKITCTMCSYFSA